MLEIQAAVKQKKNKLKIVAYSGNLLFGNTVVDIAGMDAGSDIKLLLDHDNSVGSVVGSGTAEKKSDQLVVTGNLARSEAANQVRALLEDNVPLEASIGAEVLESEQVAPGETIKANGRTFEAERALTLVTKSKLREVSIVALAADAATSVSLSAKRSDMTDNDKLQLQRERIAAEDERITGIQAAADELGSAELNTDYLKEIGVQGKTIHNLRAHAIREGWSLDKFELEARKATRVSMGDFVGVGREPAATDDVLQCSLAKHLGFAVEKSYDQRTLEASDGLRVTSVMDAIKLQLQREGAYKSSFSPAEMLKASGASTSNYTNLLGNIANKELAQAYLGQQNIARTVSRVLSANDFKTHYLIQLDDFDAKPEEVGSDGEIKHSVLSDRSTTYNVDQYARLVEISRKDLVNDDLSAFSQLPSMLARGANTALEKAFWTLVLSNPSSWFASGNNNYQSGAATALSIDSVDTAVGLAMQQVDSNGDPIGIKPRYIVVPPALMGTALSLYNSTEFRLAPSSSKTAATAINNPWQGSFEPLVSPWLGSTVGLTNSSDTAWYLVCDPAVLGFAAVAYLQGNQVPMVENVDLPSDKLGDGWRCVFDFGVALIEKKAAVLSTGAA